MKKLLSVALTVLALLFVFCLAGSAETDVPEVSSYEEIVAFVRAGLIAREESFQFRYTGSGYSAPAPNDLYAYGAEPAGGDYLRLSFNGGFPSVTRDGDGICTVSASYYTTAAQEAAVDAYVSEVVSACGQTTQEGKARFLYDYLCDNVTFDLENLYNEEDLLKYTAFGAVSEGRVVCQGFAQLYYRLALAAGLDCRIVTGTRAKEPHAWNIVKIGNTWCHVDVSSGAQLLDSSVYFAKPLFETYEISYGNYTAAEIRSYPFLTNQSDIRTGALGYLISWTLNKNTGELLISGSGDTPDYMEDLNQVFLSTRSPLWNWNSFIKYVTIADGVTGIGKGLFSACGNLKRITIPASVVNINASAFIGCGSMDEIVLAPENTVYHMDGGCLIDTAEKVLVLGRNASVIPTDGSVTSIGRYAFYGCSGFEGEMIPSFITEIGEYAFYGCAAIPSLTIPESITEISDYAFYGCESIAELTIPAYLKRIGNGAFQYCTGITELTVPASVEEIGHSAFCWCSGITELTLCPGISSISGSMFACCTGLVSVEIPDGVTKIGASAFFLCTSLESISIPDSVETLSGINTFGRCESLTELTLPDNISSLPEGALRDCTALRSVHLPDRLRTIGRFAFHSCSSLERLSFGRYLYEIGQEALDGLTSLQRFDVDPQNPNNYSSDQDGVLYYANGIKKYPAGRVDESWRVPDSVEWIYANAFESCQYLKTVDLNRVSNIDEFAFYHCGSLTALRIPEGVTAINRNTFEECSSLTTLIIPRSVTSIYYTNTGSGNALFGVNAGFTIYGYRGSYAETYAEMKNIPFVPLCPVTAEPHALIAYEANEATCTDAAYSAGEYCPDCGEWISGHEQTAEPLGHSPADPVPENVVEPTCTKEGSYDSVIRCARCGVVLSSVPERLAAVSHADGNRDGYCDDCGLFICTHEETERKNEKAATCTENGYTGDTVCSVCGGTLEYGVTVYAAGHTPVLSAAAVPATCLRQGWTERYTCGVCGVVTAEATPTPIVGHADADEDGICDVCLAPMGCELYGACGDGVYWHIAAETLVITGSGATDDFGGAAPWADYADGFNCVYVKEGVTGADGAVFNDCPRLTKIYAPAGAALTGSEKPVLSYTWSDGVITITSSSSVPEMDVYDLLNAAYVFCADRTVTALRFDTLRLNGTDGREYTEYDILRGGKIVDENHYRLPAGSVVSDISLQPLGYASYNSVIAALGDHPDRNLILKIVCEDLLTEKQKAEADAYTEQIVVRFVDEPVADTGEDDGSHGNSFIDRFRATLAAILAVFKKIVKFLKSVL